MTPKERWRRTFQREPIDRVALDYWGTPEITTRLKLRLNCRDDRELWDRLGIDKSVGIGPALHDPLADQRNGADVWGVRSRVIRYADGAGEYAEVCESPLSSAETVSDIEKFPWPDPGWWDHSSIENQCVSLNDYPIIGGTYEPFLLYCAMRGLEQGMADLVAAPEMVEAALERIFHIHYVLIERTLAAAKGAVDFIYVAEDLGSQTGPLMSLDTFRRILKPGMAKMIELAHSHGAWAFHHDDGGIRPLLPDLMEIGIDLLNPIQWRCAGMDRRELKRDYGDRLVFHGAMDNQQTLPFGTIEEVRQEVRDNIQILGENGGYILAPCHNLQVITPLENIIAMYEEAHRVGGN